MYHYLDQESQKSESSLEATRLNITLIWTKPPPLSQKRQWWHPLPIKIRSLEPNQKSKSQIQISRTKTKPLSQKRQKRPSPNQSQNQSKKQNHRFKFEELKKNIYICQKSGDTFSGPSWGDHVHPNHEGGDQNHGNHIQTNDFDQNGDVDCLSICSHIGWVWHIQNLRRAGLCKAMMLCGWLLAISQVASKSHCNWAFHAFPLGDAPIDKPLPLLLLCHCAFVVTHTQDHRMLFQSLSLAAIPLQNRQLFRAKSPLYSAQCMYILSWLTERYMYWFQHCKY